jgi:mannose-1-phosphate guanylyltransferase/mannose-6-phosphate isomerase
MTSILVQPVVMAGGGGTRLWPLSRAGFPKQFLALGGKETLFQAAVARLQGLSDAGFALAAPVVVGNDEHRFLVQEQLRELGLPSPAALLLEPLGRNTAPAMTLAALHATDDPVLVVVPADQTVSDGAAFRAAVSSAIRIAAEGAICILGITPDRPETGYGYVLAEPAGVGAARVARFVEKPDAATAARYLAEGGYYWNSGIFVLRASMWLAALEQFRPDILAAVRAAWAGRSTDAQFVRPDRNAFEAVPSESVDYAVMERCPGSRFDLRIVPLDAGWNDLGAWDAVWQQAAKDTGGNSFVGDVCSTTPATPTCTRRADSSPSSGSTTWSWSRPRMPCWWRTASAART